MPVPQQVLDLIERFTNNRAAYSSGRYNEAQARQEFINPFFEALGWDVANRQGYSERFKEVVHEDSLKVRGSTKAPDYAFRLGGQRVFFVEAKKPSVDIKEDTHPAYQLRRYAWSAKLSVSILTDFEEFAVYDCRIRPVKTDNASTARVMYLRYTDLTMRDLNFAVQATIDRIIFLRISEDRGMHRPYDTIRARDAQTASPAVGAMH